MFVCLFVCLFIYLFDHFILFRTPCNSSDPPLLYMNTTDGNTTASIQISSTINYMYTINVSAVTGAGESAAVRLAVTTPTRAEFNCQDCRIDKVTIDDLLSVVNWTVRSIFRWKPVCSFSRIMLSPCRQQKAVPVSIYTDSTSDCIEAQLW